MSRRTKRKIKNFFRITTILIIFVVALILIELCIKNINKSKLTEIVEEDVSIEEIVMEKLKKENIDTDFIKWVNKNYTNSMEKLNILLNENEYDIKMWHKVTGYSYLVLTELYNKKYESMSNVKVLEANQISSTISIVGDVSLADNWYIMPQLDERGKGIRGILSDEIINIMTKSDVMIVNSEFTVSNRGTAMSGKQYTFRAKPERLALYNDMGIDMVTLANNHVYDFGQEAFFDMLDEFDKINMPRIGAGRNLEEAMRPYYFIVNGYKVAFINATRAEKYVLTPGATETSEGVFRCYDPTNVINLIKSIRNDCDYIIPIIHYGKEGSHELEEEQITSSHQYIDAGADMVVGHHAHNLQGVEIYNDKPIIYNLGNFIFNADTVDTAIFQAKINEDGTIDYYMIPAIQHEEYTELLKNDEKQRVINDLNSWSINAIIDSEGKISKKE